MLFSFTCRGLLLAGTLLLTAGSFSHPVRASGDVPGGTFSPALTCGPPRSDATVRHRLQAYFRSWEGVSYQWGGDSRRGTDCSAFIRGLFKAQFHIRLPRTSTEQKRQGQAVAREALKTGDLVFFRTSATTRHVGVYAGGGMFMHASGSRGVTLSRLDNPYWVAHYEAARRLPLS
ncbi:C40 family peptidase [Enterobacteriaceae bacterium BIT-l23]|uniref:NlpC/P60 family protein n=1 Tax=Jejubacter sp. L23 TaxID=3092086 RepID=UPI00158562F6|nr:C40 family peptidase [Enterobacteriaceae bacterium BIT-l23]